MSLFRRYWSLFLNGILLLVLIATTSYFLLEKEDGHVVESSSVMKEVVVEVQDEKTIYVDVKGAVKKPGVYELNIGTIVNDAVKAAGGFTSKAFQNNINLSKKLQDEMVIYVYTKNEIKELNKVDNKTEVCNCKDYIIDSCTNTGNSVITSDEKLPDTNSNTDINVEDEENTKVNLNTATKEELMSLYGVGEAKAENIIKYRNENAGFKTIEEIKNISGIGDAAYEKIKDNITV